MGKIVHAFTTDGGRRFVGDEKLPTSVAGAGAGYQAQKQALAAMPAMRREVARFSGTAFTAERDGETGELVVYHLSHAGAPLVTNLTGDKAHCGCGSSLDAGRMTAAKLQERNEAWRKTVERPRTRAGER